MGDRAAAAVSPGRGRGAGSGVPGPPAALALGVGLTAFFWLTGSLQPTVLPEYVRSERAVTGMALMLILVPSWLVAGASFGQRRSLALVAELRAQLADPSQADRASEALRGSLRRTWPFGLAAGFVLGLLNTDPLFALESRAPWVTGAISAGQMVLWCVVGLLFFVRVTAAQAFRRLAEAVPLDLLRPDRVKAIARSGVVDVAIIAGALLLTPLQSLDAEFRWYNYHFGLLVALPSACFFLLWPLQPLHRRNRAERDARVAAVDEQLRRLGAGPPSDAEATARLEALLSHRSRLLAARTWPLSTALLSRVLLYLVIPPLAWAGAALVERIVDRLLGAG